MRKLVLTLAGALGIFAFLGMVSGAHTVTLNFNPASPVAEGTLVDVNFQTNRTQGNAKLFVCHLRSAQGATLPEYGAVSVCGIQNAEEPANVDGIWVALGTANETYLTTHVFNTAGLGGFTIGFLVQHPPLNETEGTALVTGDLVVNPTGNGDGHPGCNGVENAYEKVTGNNGATKGQGKGAEALQKVAQKLGCDLTE
jgi:hypothetical protein